MNMFLYKLFLYLITIFLFCSSSLHADNRLGYRGVMLGMTIKEISNLDSVKSGYMPDLNKLKCLNGEFSYDTNSNDINLYQVNESTNKIKIRIDDVIICKKHKHINLPLRGSARIFYDDIEFYFYQNKLYQMTIKYNKENTNKIKKSLDGLLKRFNTNKNYVELHFEPEINSKNKKYKIINQQYGFYSKIIPANNVNISTQYYEEKSWFKPYKKYKNIFVYFWDIKKIEYLEELSKELLYEQASHNKKVIKETKSKKNQLKKKYDY